LAVWYGLLS